MASKQTDQRDTQRDDQRDTKPDAKRDAQATQLPADSRRDKNAAGYEPHYDPDSPSYDPRYHPEDPTRHQHASPKSAKAGTPSAESRESATKGVNGEHGDYPKPFVRAKPGAGGWEAEIRMVGDDDGAQVAKDEGFAEVEQPDRRHDFVEYPKWLYHSDGRSQLVQTQDEADKLEGFEAIPPEPEEGAVPAPHNPPAGTASANRPPVPPDRG